MLYTDYKFTIVRRKRSLKHGGEGGLDVSSKGESLGTRYLLDLREVGYFILRY